MRFFFIAEQIKFSLCLLNVFAGCKKCLHDDHVVRALDKQFALNLNDL